MSGHSKWSTIKRKKGALDAKRGQIFSKVIKEITVAARMGGGDPAGNPRLKAALQKAKENNVPSDNVTRAVKKGTGELPGTQYEDIVYEGYGPAGVALLIETATDNSNRTTSDIRHLLTKNNGNLGTAGCVAWQFERKGVITIPVNAADEDELLEIVIESGAEDMRRSGEDFEIVTPPESFEKVRETLEEKGIHPGESELVMVPKNTVEVSLEDARKLLKLMEAIEEHEDVQHLWTNSDMSNDVLKQLEDDSK